MKNHLELISLEKLYPKKERITLPRYPIPQLTFRQILNSDENARMHGLEVRDISTSGLQLENKLNAISWEVGDHITGNLKFGDEKILIDAEVVWVKQSRAGLKFKTQALKDKIQDTVLNIDQLCQSLRPLHTSLIQEKPLDLRYWLQATGPLEFMVWGTQAEPLASSLWIYSHFFVQWNDLEGLKTGKIYRQRADDEWNLMEGECVLLFDHKINQELLGYLSQFMGNLNADDFLGDDYAILKSKLS